MSQIDKNVSDIASFGGVTRSHSTKLNSLEKQLSTVTQAVHALRKDINALSGKVGIIDTQVGSIDKTVKVLINDVNTASTKATSALSTANANRNHLVRAVWAIRAALSELYGSGSMEDRTAKSKINQLLKDLGISSGSWK